FHKYESLQGQVIWDSLKPHVIYGYVRVDTSSMLTILAGTKVYLHKDSRLDVLSQSTLKIAGNLDHPVRFQSDRLDPFYRDLPGQWSGVFLEKGSKDNEINYAVLKNGLYGVLADSASGYALPMLKIDNTIIRNMTYDGIYAYASSIVSTNCVIGDCGNSAITADFGGSYDFRQLTVANYWGSSVRIGPSVYIRNYYYDTQGNLIYNGLVKAYFGNAIIAGNLADEVGIDMKPQADSVYTFDHCLLFTKRNITAAPDQFISCLVNEDPKFLDIQNFDYRIDSISPAIDKGIPMGVPFDILGVDRGSTPDLGAYEWAPGP
ncbi:MAG TPA: choice-of-anchor Q domain-containing protein, partial [Bacteroidales bacterium]|nr:choice-of-anchor Q domain-containing protein [Bacteroidales bacterium]